MVCCRSDLQYSACIAECILVSVYMLLSRSHLLFKFAEYGALFMCTGQQFIPLQIGGGLECHCVGPVYVVNGAVPRKHDLRSGFKDHHISKKLGAEKPYVAT